MHRTTLWMMVISMTALFTWVFLEYAIEARRILRARSLQRQQRLAQTTAYDSESVTTGPAVAPTTGNWAAERHVAGHTG